MDAPEEDLDIKLQKISRDLIDDFDKSLPFFLRKGGKLGVNTVRSRVQQRETERLCHSVSSHTLTPIMHDASPMLTSGSRRQAS